MAIEENLNSGFLISSPYTVQWGSGLGHGCDVNIANGAVAFVGTLELQISYNKGVKFYPVKTYTAPQSEILRSFQPGAFVRLEFIAFTSGDADIRLGSGPV